MLNLGGDSSQKKDKNCRRLQLDPSDVDGSVAIKSIRNSNS